MTIVILFAAKVAFFIEMKKLKRSLPDFFGSFQALNGAKMGVFGAETDFFGSFQHFSVFSKNRAGPRDLEGRPI